VVKYDIPQGERRGIDVDLTDATYDGIVDGQRLSGGLGQLTDGELGQSNFRAVDRRGTGIKASYTSCSLKHSYCYKGRGFYVSWFCFDKTIDISLQCFDTVRWTTGRASGL